MLLDKLLSRMIKGGTLTVIDADGRSRRYGNGGAPRSAIKLHHRSLSRRLALNPRLAFGEAYMDGTLTIEEGTLYDFLDVCGLNMDNLSGGGFVAVARWLRPVLRRLHQYNPVARARSNVAHHYDLSGTLYDLFLDKDKQYSCAYFATDNDDIDIAQENKKRHLAAKLLLEPGMKVLDIGCGWGGLGLYLAKTENVDVTGITLSTEQQRAAVRRAEEDGLSDRVRFHLRDYRHESGRYDRIVSVGMFEHVGVGHYQEYFDRIRQLLTDDGVAVLHTIGRMEPPGSTNPWLRKYIFPGGYTPALSEIVVPIERVGLWITDIEVLRLHYAETLREWHRRFQRNRDQVRALYDERFCRMWEFYLQGCEMAFRRMGQTVFQIQLAKRQDAVPLTRDYVVDYEREHVNAAHAA